MERARAVTLTPTTSLLVLGPSWCQVLAVSEGQHPSVPGLLDGALDGLLMSPGAAWVPCVLGSCRRAWDLRAELFFFCIRRRDPRGPVQCPQLLVNDVPDQVRAHE